MCGERAERVTKKKQGVAVPFPLCGVVWCRGYKSRREASSTQGIIFLSLSWKDEERVGHRGSEIMVVVRRKGGTRDWEENRRKAEDMLLTFVFSVVRENAKREKKERSLLRWCGLKKRPQTKLA